MTPTRVPLALAPSGLETGWKAAVDDFLLALRGQKEAKTEAFYRSRLQQLQAWAVANDVALADFRARHMRQYLAFRAEEIGTPPRPRVSEHTRHHDAVAARVFCRFCHKEEYAPLDALKEYEVPKAPRAYVKMPSADEITRLLKAIVARNDVRANPAARTTSARDRAFWRVRDYALVCLLVETGLRIGEAFALELSDYQPDNCRVLVRVSKTNESRFVPITPALQAPLAAYLAKRPKVDSPLLFINMFGQAMTQNSFAKQFRAYLAFAGLETFTRHGLRHFTLTQMVGQNARSAQLIAGHKDINTTMRYDHTAMEKVQADHATVSPLGKILVHKRGADTAKRKKVL